MAYYWRLNDAIKGAILSKLASFCRVSPHLALVPKNHILTPAHPRGGPAIIDLPRLFLIYDVLELGDRTGTGVKKCR
jgi:hypothetical protein